MAKESKRSNWHSSQPGQVSAPLILDPVPGDILDKINTVCEKFEQMNGNRVQVCPRAGKSVKVDAKPEPSRRLGCDREDCLPCQSPGSIKGDCEKNSGTYKNTCQTCRLYGEKTTYKGETGRNAFPGGVEHQHGLPAKRVSRALCGSTAVSHPFPPNLQNTFTPVGARELTFERRLTFPTCHVSSDACHM